jgi:predicted DNA-binding transcriptional regulator AlpA
MDAQIAQEAKTKIKFINSRVTENLSGMSRWTLWRWEKEGRFPKSIKLNSARVWIESEVLAWMQEQIAKRDGGAG